MEIKWPREQSQWLSNVRTMQRRIKDRLRITSSSYVFLRQMHRSGTAVAYASAGTRVFKGNVVFSRALHNIARQLRSTLKLAAGAGSGELASVDACLCRSQLTTSLPHSVDSQSPETQLRAGISERTEANYTAIFGENSHVVRLLQAVALPIIGNVCRAFMHGFNSTEVYGAEKFVDAILHRPQGQALITVSNHVASMDDPLVLAAMLPPQLLLDANCLRWTLCATDRCFTNAATSAFFRCVKVLPLARGGGVYQKGIDLAVEKLKRGDWVHIFPEGSRSRDGGKTIQNAKRGIGRLVLDAGEVPLVVPFVHSGMQEVMPIGSKFPSTRKKVIVLVGDPIKMDDLVASFEKNELPKAALYEAIALRVGQHLKRLKTELDRLVSSGSVTEQQQLPIPKETDADWRTAEVGLEEVLSKGNTVQKYLKQSHAHEREDDQSVIDQCSEDLRPRKPPIEMVEEAWWLESRLLPGVMSTLQEGIVTRLHRFMDPAVFVGFAAQGSLRCSRYWGTGGAMLRN